MKKKDLFRCVTAVAFLSFLVVLTVFSVLAVRKLAECYETLKNGDLVNGFTGSIYYDDKLYIMLGHGIEVVANEPNAGQRLNDFLNASLLSIDKSILACGLFYTMIAVSFLLYNLFSNKEESGKKQVFKTALTTVLTFTFYLGMILISHLIFHVPFCIPEIKELLAIFAGLTSIIAGSCAAGFLIKVVPFKKIVSIILIPVIILLFMLSTAFEARLFMPSRIDSFDYVYEMKEEILDKNYEGEVYYDEDKNVLVVEGEEYPPEQIDNPDSLRGPSRIGAFLFEAADPYSGTGLFLAEKALEIDSSPLLSAGYLLKAAIWIALAKFKK